MLSEAEKKFWGCPKLIENLLPFLDTYSIICLAQVDAPPQIPCTILNTKFAIPKLFPYLDSNSISTAQAYKPALGAILDKSVWSKLIKRVCNWRRTLKSSNQEKDFQQMRIQVTYILNCRFVERVLNIYAKTMDNLHKKQVS